MSASMNDGRAGDVVQLLHNILGEVRTVKKTVEKHESRLDDVFFELKKLQSHDTAFLTNLPRVSCDLEMARCSLDEKAVDERTPQATNLGPRDSILWNRNPLAASTDSLHTNTSEKAESPVCEAVPASLHTPASRERMITISSVVNHSLASIPLHRLADRPQSARHMCPSDVAQTRHQSRSVPASPARHSDLQDTPKSSFGKRTTALTDFNSSTASDIDHSAPADPLTTHSASSLSTSYSLDPLRPSPPFFRGASSSADATINPAAFHGPFGTGTQPNTEPRSRVGEAGQQVGVSRPFKSCLNSSSPSLQISRSTVQGAANDNDKDLVNLTTTGNMQCGSHPTRSMTYNKNGHCSMNTSACDSIMCSMNGGLTFRHMLEEPSVFPSPTACNSSCSDGTRSGDAQKSLDIRATAAMRKSRGKMNQACNVTESLSPREPMLTFRVMLPATPEEQSGNCAHDSDHDMRSSSAPTDYSPAPSSLGSDLTDPNDDSQMSRSSHLDCCFNTVCDEGEINAGCEEHLFNGAKSECKETRSSVSLMRPVLHSCHGELNSNMRYDGRHTSHSDVRSPFSRSTSASSTPKRKFEEMRQAGASGVRPHSTYAAQDHLRRDHVHHVPRLQLPQPGTRSSPTIRCLSPQLHAPYAITDFALQCDSRDGSSPRAMGRYSHHCGFEPSNSVDSDDMLPCGNMEQASPDNAPAPYVTEEMECEDHADENTSPDQRDLHPASNRSLESCMNMMPDGTPAAAQASSESSYESPPSLIPPPSSKATSQQNTCMNSAAGSECNVEIGSCSPVLNCVLPPAHMSQNGQEGGEDVHGSPCMRASAAFAPTKAMASLPPFKPDQASRFESTESLARSTGSSNKDLCIKAGSSHSLGDSPLISGSTVYSSYYSRSVENVCPNAGAFIPDTPSSRTSSDIHQITSCAINADCLTSQPPVSGGFGQQVRPRVQDGRHYESECQAESCQHTNSCASDMFPTSCSMSPEEADATSSRTICQQAAESLTSDEINAWKAHNCIPSLIQGNEDDSLVILTNNLLRSAFRAQRRAEMQKSLSTGGSYAAPRRFLCTPLDPSVLDALAVPMAVRASEMSETVENIIDATLPRTLRLSHCFAAWRYIMGGGGAACSQSVETLGDAKTPESPQPSGSETLASDLCTEDAVSCIRRTVINSCLFSVSRDTDLFAEVRASTVSNARSGPDTHIFKTV